MTSPEGPRLPIALLAIAVSAAVLRALFVIVAAGAQLNPGNAPGETDALAYHSLAVSLLHGEGFTHEGMPTAYRPPLYPASLALVYAVAGEGDFLAVRLVQALLGGLTVLCIGLTTLRLTSSPLAASLAALLLALNPLHLYFTGMLYTETLFGLLLALTLWLAVGVDGRGAWLVLLGAVLGLAVLTRSTAAVLAPCVLAAAALRAGPHAAQRRTRCRASFVAVLLVMAGIAIATGPWLARNARLAGEIAPLTTNGGINLVHGMSPDWTRGIGAADLALIDHSIPHAARVWPGSAVRDAAGARAPDARAWLRAEVEWDQSLTALGFERMRQQPGRALRLCARKWLHYFSPASTDRRPLVQALAFTPLLLGFLAWPLASRGAASRRARAAWVFAGVAVLLFSLVHAVYMSDVRFRVPIAEPYFAVFAGDTLRRILRGGSTSPGAWFR